MRQVVLRGKYGYVSLLTIQNQCSFAVISLWRSRTIGLGYASLGSPDEPGIMVYNFWGKRRKAKEMAKYGYQYG